MAITYPLPLDDFAKYLRGDLLPLALTRYDEMSGVGDGREWSVQMAPPKWTTAIALLDKPLAEAHRLNAQVNGLAGSQKTFLFADGYYRGPAWGRSGLGAVKVNSIRPDRCAISLSGVPDGYVITTGDKFSIPYASGRIYFGEFAETRPAAAGGIATGADIQPPLPQGIATSAAVELVRPFFKAIVPSGGWTPFAPFRGQWGSGASIQILQKV